MNITERLEHHARELRQLVKPDAAAELLGVHPATLARWRMDGSGPVFVKMGRIVGYHPTDLADWIESRRQATTARSA